MHPIDLRSDTVTRPDGPMYEALRAAPLGDDVLGDDPVTRRLEERAAETLGKEAALFVPSGTMGNSIAIAVSTRPGDEVLIEAQSHSLLFEAGGGARLWGVQMVPLPGEGGAVPLHAIRESIRPEDVHFARTRLLILEQTSNLAGGRILPLPYLREVRSLTRVLGLGLHLDGARIFNAQVAAGVPAREFAACADTVMFCLSKGLGAPAGSILAGPAGLLAEARRVRKLLGGGMRQAGVLAACGLHALEHNVERLAEDHENARELARAVTGAGIAGVRAEVPETNMVYVTIQGAPPDRLRRLVDALRARGVLALAVLGRSVRFVFHRDVSRAAARTAQEAVVGVLRDEAGLGAGKL
ncbi:MAG TPA: low-specificity L-threonine aldolase [Planctomycetota bacterium]|nr:low-specificity L-threonine aldolase [Planctomycetota bacterium]